MKKLFAALSLCGLFAAGTMLAVAQAPKPDPKADPKKPADPKTASKGALVVKPDAKGKFRLYVRDGDGKTMLMSAGAGFDTEKEAKEAFDEVKKIVADGKVTTEKADEKEK